jgi:cytochrome c oxidase assembly protein subunit 15
MSRTRFLLHATLSIIYLVIIAGAVVRMTGSGMGCPDWPKCFGYYIPPTEAEALEWKPDQNYRKGQVIIREEKLEVAQRDFTSTKIYNPSNWEAYTKHDYALFNPWHTWIEYINRLLGALAGLFTLALFISTLFEPKRNRKHIVIAGLILFGILFQAWLGATVVYSVLNPLKITLHMLMALVLVALLFYLKAQIDQEQPETSELTRHRLMLITALSLTLIQVLFGTQVRQSVDHFIDDGNPIATWIQNAPVLFYIHRSFSILVLLVNGILFYRLRKTSAFYFTYYQVVLGLILIEIGTGIAMSYFEFPFSSQPLHLVIASLLFGVQAYLVMKSNGRLAPSKS